MIDLVDGPYVTIFMLLLIVAGMISVGRNFAEDAERSKRENQLLQDALCGAFGVIGYPPENPTASYGLTIRDEARKTIAVLRCPVVPQGRSS